MLKKGITRRELEVTDYNEIINILNTCRILNLGLVDGDEPYVIAMNYGYTMEDGQLVLYLHGAKEGRKLDLIRKNPKVYISMNCEVEAFDGDIACKYGTAYSSFAGRGTAQLIEDTEEKIKGLSILMKTQTGQDFEITERMVSVVSIIKITVSEYTAKRRPKPADAR